MIAAHGNGTPQSDASEAAAIRRVFGNAAPPATAFKWAFGHLIAAAGILDAVLALHALRERSVPGVATHAVADSACEGVRVTAGAQGPRSDIALILCRGFAGTNAALLLRAAR
jgi:3-oxoacyl-[acyl-carrier-protein] synthase-1